MENDNKVHHNIKISGKVQGVWFRKHTKDVAEKLGLKGWVRNEPDGSVYVEAEGPEDLLEQFENWCHKGSPAAEVKDVTVEEGTIKNYDEFNISS